MKKILTFFAISAFLIMPAFSAADKFSEDYLKNRHHFSVMNPFAERVAQKVIKKALKKESGGRFKVKLDGYTLGSMKQGVFKYLEITGKNVEAAGVKIPYINIKTISDYNVIDFRQNPPIFKTDIDFYYTVKISEDTINDALSNDDYKKVIQKFNRNIYPVLIIYDVKVNIKDDKLFMTFEYNFPIAPHKRNRTATISAGVYVKNGRIRTHNIGFDNPNGNLPINRIISMINIIDPLSFTINLIEDKNCEGRIEKALIKDDIIQVNGRILVKKDCEVK